MSLWESVRATHKNKNNRKNNVEFHYQRRNQLFWFVFCISELNGNVEIEVEMRGRNVELLRINRNTKGWHMYSK